MSYLVLPSNSSFKHYPNNTVTNYITHTPVEYNLVGQWEVGLAEIQYTHDWYSYEESDSVALAILCNEGIKLRDGKVQSMFKISIPPGYYKNKGELVEEINRLVELRVSEDILEKQCTGNVEFIWNKYTDKIILKVGDTMSVGLSKSLSQLLGFPLQYPYVDFAPFTSGVYESSVKGTLNQHLSALYVYCSIVQPRVVGNSLVKLLRPVPVTSEHGRNVFFSFQDIHFLPLATNIFQDIEIDIRDDTGKKIPFVGGRVVVTLHLRRKSPF